LQGQLEAARRTFERGLRISSTFRTTSSIGLALCQLLLGQRDDGLRALSRGLEVSGDPLAPQRKIMTRYGMLPAGAYLAAGLPEEAEAIAAQGLALATVDDARAYHVPLGRIHAEALALQGKEPRHDEALSDWGRLLDLATELSMRPEVAHCHLGLGKLHRHTGDDAKAEEHLATATAMYREMGMTFWLEKADAELGGVVADALRRGLAELGWVEGENILIEWRYAEGRPERHPALIADLIRLKVDVIVAGGGTAGARAAKDATRTIPIVMPVFEFVINLKTAKALGLTIPPAVLARADEVIQ
jgi:tetratricopeptide (TPR) repeat protein